jgi:hypothetical protein
VIAASSALRLTYILPAELVFKDIMARWDMEPSRIQELFEISPVVPADEYVEDSCKKMRKKLT